MIILDSEAGNYIISNGKRYSYFAGNNYLGLASHPKMKEAVIEAVAKYGVNFAASRHTTGTSDLHLRLENALARFKVKNDAVVFASGYQGNSILLEGLKGDSQAVFTDEHAHASIVTAVREKEVSFHYYNHCDDRHLDSLMSKSDFRDKLVITDGVFALTGEIAPLDRIYKVVKKHNAVLIVDDAHATGVLGVNGRGSPEHFGLDGNDDIIQTETMSKALGGYGGFIADRRDITNAIRNRSATYQASTALPPPIVAAGIASLEIIGNNPELRTELMNKANELRDIITDLNFTTTGEATPIIPLLFENREEAKDLSGYLEKNNVIVPFINYPGKNSMHLLRLTISVSHTNDQINHLTNLLKKWRKRK